MTASCSINGDKVEELSARVHKGVSILRETRNLERQTMLGGRSLSRH